MLLPVLIAIPLLLIWVLTLVDLVRRHDLNAGRKAAWAIFVLLVPVVGVIVYFVVRPPQAERPARDARRRRRRVLRAHPPAPWTRIATAWMQRWRARVAHYSHVQQRDRRGEPIVEHVARVVAAVPEEAQAVAWLHDVLEHSPTTAAELCRHGLTGVELDALDLLTRQAGESYELYILRVAYAPRRGGAPCSPGQAGRPRRPPRTRLGPGRPALRVGAPARRGRQGPGRLELEQAQLARAGHGLRARRRVELAVDRLSLRLDRVGRHVEARSHLAEGEVGGQQRQDPQLGGGQRRRRDRSREAEYASTCADASSSQAARTGASGVARTASAAASMSARAPTTSLSRSAARARTILTSRDVPRDEVVHRVQQARRFGAVVRGRLDAAALGLGQRGDGEHQAHRRVPGQPEALDLRARAGRELGGQRPSRRGRARAARAGRGTAR